MAGQGPPAVLVTGMSGTGKSSALRVLHSRGYATADTDENDLSHWAPLPDGRLDWAWRQDAVAALLARPRRQPLFVAGTSMNQGAFYDRFTHVALLSAPADVLLARVATRSGNAYGSTEADRRKILHDLAETQPLLRRGATVEIDATGPLGEVADALQRLVEPR